MTGLELATLRATFVRFMQNESLSNYGHYVFFSIASDYNVASNERHIKIHIQQSSQFNI